MPLVSSVLSIGIWRVPRREHLFDFGYQAGRIGDVRHGRQQELSGKNAGAAHTGGEVEILHGAIEHQQRGAQAVTIFDTVCGGILDERR